MNIQEYTLHVVNNSSRTWDMCLYQRGPDVGPGRFPVAWLVKRTHPSAKVTFRWPAAAWSFVWAETGSLAPGGRFDVAQAWPADPAIHRPATATTAGNRVELARLQGVYTFTPSPADGPVPAGSVQVTTDPAVQPGRVGVGIGSAGAAVLATQGKPGSAVDLALLPRYFIAAGSYFQGEVLDAQPIPASPEVVFPEGIDAMTATLEDDGRWRIEPTPPSRRLLDVAAADLPGARG